MAGVRPNEYTSADRRMALAREWDDLVDQVRGVAGFADFLRPPTLATMVDIAEAGPVVIVNVSNHRCDALVVTAERVEPVALPGLTAADVHAHSSRYLDALRDEPVVANVPFARAVEQRAAMLRRREAELDSIMRWLWDAVAEPVLRALGWADPAHQRQPPRRVWWCPTGPLTLVPVHGAGYHDGTGRTVIDCVVSSYTPTLRALAEARRRPPRACGDEPALFVGMPDTVGQVQLTEAVARERAVVDATVPGGVQAIVGAQATVAAVATAMTRRPWVHLSCHGQQDLDDPTRAGFVLADGSLTVMSLGATRFSGELAYLSACRTATGGTRLADEIITLAAALNYAGFRHVVGALWTVRPEIAATVAELVYPALVHDGTPDAERAASALHDAVRSLRDGGTRLADWLSFVHYGP